MSRRAAVVAAGFLAGALAGMAVWSVQMHRCRRDLFSPSPFRRRAALSYLRGRPGLDTVRLLSDYVRWEQHPALRRAGERLLHAMHVHFA